MTDLRGGVRHCAFPVETLLCSHEVRALGVLFVRGQQDVLGVLFNYKK